MDILSLEIKNFGPIQEAYLNLHEKGLVNIEGQNNDDPSANSNGSGKSTIPDALYWCLFGQTARGVSGDEVIANFAGKDCYVATLIQDGEDRFLIERWRKKKGFKGKLSGLALSRTDSAGTVVDLTDGTDKLTQAKIELVLGCSEDVFTKAVYSGQEAMPDLPAMTDKQIKELVEEAAGIEVLTKAHDLAKAHCREAERVFENANRDFVDLERRFHDKKATVDGLDERITTWVDAQRRKVDNKTDELRALVSDAKDVAAARDKIDVTALTSTLTANRSRVSDVEKERDAERALQNKLSSANKSASASRAALDAKLREIKRAQTHLEHLHSKVGSPCGECGKAYEEGDIAEAHKIGEGKLAELITEGRLLKRDNTAADAAVETAQTELETYRAGMTDVSATVEEITRLQRQINEHSRLNTEVQTISEKAKRCKDDIDKLKAEENPFIALKTKEEAALTDLSTDLANAGLKLQELEKDCEVARDAVRCFGPAGVRAYVLDTVTPYLNERTAHYLGTLSDGRIEAVWTTLARNAKGELTERFAIEVEKEGGGKTFRALSGGEKRKVRLACALALQDLVASRATKPINLWLGDEVDDALDEAGLERLMTILEEKAREKGTVIVISHRSLKDWIRETVEVTMCGGVSTITGVLC